jgi:serine/threonine protein kinase
MIDHATGAVKLGDFGLVRALHRGGEERGVSSGSGGFATECAALQPRGVPRSNSYPRIGAATSASAAAAAPRAGIAGVGVATGGTWLGASVPTEPRSPAPSIGSRLIRRLTPLILGPPGAASGPGASDAWPPAPAAPLQAARPRLRRQMTPNTGSLVTMAPEVWASPEYGTSADVYSLGRLICYMKALAWRWRGVPALDALEAACTREEPALRPTVCAQCALVGTLGMIAWCASEDDHLLLALCAGG